MKKFIFSLLGCVMVCSLSLCLTACGDDEDDNKPAEVVSDKLSGEWMGFYFGEGEDMALMAITFNEDLTGSYFTEFDEEGNTNDVTFTYIYTKVNGKLVVKTATETKNWLFNDLGNGTATLEADGKTYNLMDVNNVPDDPEEGDSPFDEYVELDPDQPIVGKWLCYDEDGFLIMLIMRADNTCRYTIFDEDYEIDVDVEENWKEGDTAGTYIMYGDGLEFTLTLGDDDTLNYNGYYTMTRYSDDED